VNIAIDMGVPYFNVPSLWWLRISG